MEPEKLRVTVARNEHNNSVTVVVSCVKTPKVSTSQELRKAITRAVGAWHMLPAGQQAWDYASDDFNVGDLGMYLDDPTLIELLRAEGVVDLSIEDAPEQDPDWSYDTVLTSRKFDPDTE